MGSYLIEYAHTSSSDPQVLVATWGCPLEVLHIVAEREKIAPVRPLFIGALSDNVHRWMERIFRIEQESEGDPRITIPALALHEARDTFFREGRELALNPVEAGCSHQLSCMDDKVMKMERADEMQVDTTLCTDFFHYHIVRGIKTELAAKGLERMMRR